MKHKDVGLRGRFEIRSDLDIEELAGLIEAFLGCKPFKISHCDSYKGYESLETEILGANFVLLGKPCSPDVIKEWNEGIFGLLIDDQGPFSDKAIGVDLSNRVCSLLAEIKSIEIKALALLP